MPLPICPYCYCEIIFRKLGGFAAAPIGCRCKKRNHINLRSAYCFRCDACNKEKFIFRFQTNDQLGEFYLESMQRPWFGHACDSNSLTVKEVHGTDDFDCIAKVAALAIDVDWKDRRVLYASGTHFEGYLIVEALPATLKEGSLVGLRGMRIEEGGAIRDLQDDLFSYSYNSITTSDGLELKVYSQVMKCNSCKKIMPCHEHLEHLGANCHPPV